MKPILITVGEPAGIGPDCILRLHAARPEMFANCIVAAPAVWLNERAELIGMEAHASEVQELPETIVSKKTLQCWNPLVSEKTGDIAADICTGPVSAGHPSPATSTAVIACIEATALACLAGHASGMVTGPIEKAILRNSGFSFPGHTEFMAHLAGNPDFVMMLASDELRVALLTTHMALADVPAALSIDHVQTCLRIVATDLVSRFGITEPRIGLCGLNPHAGEQGHFGEEEIRILAPAAESARDNGIRVVGPLPADTIFSVPMRRDFDAIVCCYHDQGLIPLKALSFGEAVNVTLGLPFIRTSVDHGTALDRAGSSKVSYSSLEAAIAMATEMSHKAAAREVRDEIKV